MFVRVICEWPEIHSVSRLCLLQSIRITVVKVHARIFNPSVSCNACAVIQPELVSFLNLSWLFLRVFFLSLKALKYYRKLTIPHRPPKKREASLFSALRVFVQHLLPNFFPFGFVFFFFLSLLSFASLTVYKFARPSSLVLVIHRQREKISAQARRCVCEAAAAGREF